MFRFVLLWFMCCVVFGVGVGVACVVVLLWCVVVCGVFCVGVCVVCVLVCVVVWCDVVCVGMFGLF